MANDFNFGGDDNSSYHKTVALCVAAASMVVLLFLVALYVKSDDKKHKRAEINNQEEVTEENVLDEAHNFTSDELDFWESTDSGLEDIRKDPEGEIVSYKNNDDKKTDGAEDKDSSKDTDASKDTDNDDKKDDSKSEDGDESMNHDADDIPDGRLAVTDEKGVKKYYEILSKVAKNDYDFEEYLTNEDGKVSYKDEKREAITGVDLSKYNGDVDFARVKESGIDFAMLRLGSRGYGSGIISLDEKFVDYAQNAVMNNIPIGAYFYSQAITEAEAIEEANYIVGAVTSFTIKYPIAIDVEKVSEDDARTNKLTAKERTAIVKAFCDTVKNFGYKPCVYATRDMLISGLELETLDGIDIWVSDGNVPTDYPYKFTMWQYTNKGHVDGINDEVDLNLSFVNYEQR